MKHIRIFIIMVLVYPLTAWAMDYAMRETQSWRHYFYGGVIVGVIVVTILYFLNKSKNNIA